MDSRKYIFANGVMTLNPNYSQNFSQNYMSNTVSPLAVISSTEDILLASEIQKAAIGQALQITPSTENSLAYVQSPPYYQQIGEHDPLINQPIDELSKIFEQYNMPIGMLKKLLDLANYELHFIVDDSGSMTNKTDVLVKHTSQQIQRRYGSKAQNKKITRWEEVEDRLHILVDILAYIPTKRITISFLNRDDALHFGHKKYTPKEFRQHAHSRIKKVFNTEPSGSTPIYSALQSSFKRAAKHPTMIYLATDGEPTDCNISALKELIKLRDVPQNCPLTFISCTGDDDKAAWMKDIEGDAPFVSELDDFTSEAQEVKAKQGAVLPFTRGFWLLCHLVAAINPNDLDALDEKTPFTRKTLNELLGRMITEQEYQFYWKYHPEAKQYAHFYPYYNRDDLIAKEVPAAIARDAELIRTQNTSMQSSTALIGQIIPMSSTVTSQETVAYTSNQPVSQQIVYSQPGPQLFAPATTSTVVAPVPSPVNVEHITIASAPARSLL